MTEPDPTRPGSSTAGYHGASIPSSPRPSVASRASGSSLRKERERQQEAARPVSVAQSHSQSQSPQPPPAAAATPLEGAPDKINADEGTPSFSPFFTLVSTSEHASQRQTTHHPTVHYIFADDDPEVLSAALRQHSLGADEQPETEDEQSTLIRPGDRAIILDMVSTADGTGLEVACANSLSPDWAVMSAQVRRMEGGGEAGNTTAGEHDAAALMLKIEGVSIEPSQYTLVPWGKTPSPEAELQSASGSAPPATSSEEYPGLLSDFDKRMALLRRVVESGLERQRIVEAGREGTHEEDPQQRREDRTGPSPATADDGNGLKE